MAKVKKTQNEVQTEVTEVVEAELDLMELFFYLVERAKNIIIVAIIGALLMGVYSTMIARPVYQATSKLYVLTPQDSAVNLSDLQIGSYLTQDYLEVFDTWEVQAMVKQNLGLDYTYKRLRNMLSLDNPNNTRMLYMTVSSYDPQEAADIANEFARVAQQYISEIMLTEEPSLMSEALVPEDPVSPNKIGNVIKGFLAGALLMCIVFIIRFFLDDRVKSADDIRRFTGMTVLAIVPINGVEDENTPPGYRYGPGEITNSKERRRDK